MAVVVFFRCLLRADPSPQKEIKLFTMNSILLKIGGEGHHPKTSTTGGATAGGPFDALAGSTSSLSRDDSSSDPWSEESPGTPLPDRDNRRRSPDSAEKAW